MTAKVPFRLLPASSSLWLFGLFLAGQVIPQQAPQEEGWVTGSVAPTPAAALYPWETEPEMAPSPAAAAVMAGVGNAADAATPELQDLARGLFYNPADIFIWVRDNIHYENYYGVKKGAMLTYLERAGNDADTCALLASLLRLCPTVAEVKYVEGGCVVPRQSAANWLGVSETFDTIQLWTALVSGGVPFERVQVLSGNAGLEVKRWWLRAQINGVGTREMDPSFKVHELQTGISIPGLVSRTPSLLEQAAGGTENMSAGTVTGLNSAAVETYLDQASTEFVTGLTNNHHSASGRQLTAQVSRQSMLTDGSSAMYFPLTTGSWFGELSVDALPTSLFSTITVTFSNAAPVEISIPELKGDILYIESGYYSPAQIQEGSAYVRVPGAQPFGGTFTPYPTGGPIKLDPRMKNLVGQAVSFYEELPHGMLGLVPAGIPYPKGVTTSIFLSGGEQPLQAIELPSKPRVFGFTQPGELKRASPGTGATTLATEILSRSATWVPEPNWGNKLLSSDLWSDPLWYVNDPGHWIVGSGLPADASYTIAVKHAVSSFNQSTLAKPLPRGGKRVILYGTRVSPQLLAYYEEKMPLNPGDHALALAVIGYTWLQQTESAGQMLADIAEMNLHFQHRVGIVADDFFNGIGGFYIDVPMQNVSIVGRTSAAALRTAEFLAAKSLVDSAMEHGVIAQLQGGQNAASTVALLKKGNSEGDKTTYLSTPSNWTSIKDLLTGYSGADKATIESLLTGSGATAASRALLPKKGNQVMLGNPGEWQGAGYMCWKALENGTQILMGISGGLHGGYNPSRAPVHPPHHSSAGCQLSSSILHRTGWPQPRDGR